MQQYSEDEIYLNTILELYRRDHNLFCLEQLKIKTKESQLIPLKLNGCQKMLYSMVRAIKDRGDPLRVVCLKPRQCGSSTFWQSLLFEKTVLNPFTNSMIAAHDIDSSEILFLMSKLFLDNMSPRIKPMTRHSSKRELIFENPKERYRHLNPGLRSRLSVFTANNLSLGASQTLHNVMLSEVGRYENTELMQSSLGPAVPHHIDSMIVMESTAVGANSFFHKQYNDAKLGHSNFKHIFIPWYLHEEYAIPLIEGEKFKLDKEESWLNKKLGLTFEQLKWRRIKLKDYDDPDLFRQDFPQDDEEAWVYSGRKVFDVSKLKEMMTHMRPPVKRGEIIVGPRFMQDDQFGNLEIWEEPIENQQYDIGVDCSIGVTGGDYSCAVIIKRSNKEVVAIWHGHIDPIDFAYRLAPMGIYYNRAQVGVEINGVGYDTNRELNQKIGYSELYQWRLQDRAVPKLTDKIGWVTTHESKKSIITLARHYMNQGKTVFHSMDLWNEMLNYVTFGSDKYGADSGWHDDRVQAFMIALKISDDETYDYDLDVVTKVVEKVREKHLYLDWDFRQSPNKDWMNL